MPNMCIVFFVSMFVTGLFYRHFSHDSPVDVVFSHFTRCSVPLCLPFLFLCVVRRGVCVFVSVSVSVSVSVFVSVTFDLVVLYNKHTTNSRPTANWETRRDGRCVVRVVSVVWRLCTRT